MLELKNVKKHYNSELIFQIPHLQLDNGIFLVSGKNGSGKTTFLKIIGGLLPFEGNIL
jgi:ABC-2 type transport system ATP-binding protein